MDDYQTQQFDNSHATFFTIFVIFGVFVVMIVCLLRAFLRFIQDAAYKRPSQQVPEDLESNGRNKNGYILPSQRRVPIIVRSSNSALHSNKSVNLQPIPNYFVQRQTRDQTDSNLTTDLHPAITETLLRNPEVVPSNRPPSYQEAMASSSNELNNLLPPLK